MSPASRLLPRPVLALLVQSGQLWELRPGRHHYKLFVAGRMVQVVPRSCHDAGRQTRNMEACIRRALRGAGRAA